MTRRGALVAVALTLVMAPATAAGQAGSQPDLMIVSRGGAVLTGDDLYNEDGVGQQRNVIVEDRTVLRVRIENDGTEHSTFAISGSSQSAGFHIHYLTVDADVTGPDLPGNVETGLFTQRVDVGEASRFRVVIKADAGAPLGATQLVQITATDGNAIDTVRVTVTKVSTPE